MKVCAWFADMARDFRVSKSHFSHVSFAAFGLGNSEYSIADDVTSNYCKAAVDLAIDLERMGANQLVEVGMGDASGRLGTIDRRLASWGDVSRGHWCA